MSGSTLVRWGGMAAFLGGLLFAVLDIAYIVAFGDAPESVAAAMGAWLPLLLVNLVANLLILLGLVGLYASQSEESGTFGVISFLVALAGTAMHFSFIWTGAFVIPALAATAPEFLDAVDAGPTGTVALGFILTFLLSSVGWLLFGLSALLTNRLPRLASVLLMIGGVLVFVFLFADVPIQNVVFGLALAWLGWSLWSEKPTLSPASSM